VAEREIPFGELDAEDLLRRLGLAIKRINELEERFPFLSEKFIETMNELGAYAHEKHGKDNLLQHRTRTRDRHRAFQIAEHAEAHFDQYLRNIPHDHFNTRRHQLAAVAFNAMMEYVFAGLDNDPWEL
jgi:hypothetical protein